MEAHPNEKKRRSSIRDSTSPTNVHGILKNKEKNEEENQLSFGVRFPNEETSEEQAKMPSLTDR